MLVCKKHTDDPTIIGPPTIISKYLPKIRNFISSKIAGLQKTNNPILHSLNIFPTGLHKYINSTDVDIVHLHWINGEMLSIKEIEKINKPIVWTLHDSWAFCGAEHHSAIENDSRYINGYNKNNRNVGDSGVDLNRWIWNKKNKYWKDIPLTIVCPSKWLYENCKNSYLFKNADIYNIPNCISTEDFSPLDKSIARELFNLPLNKKYILFGAINATNHPLKGYDILVKTLGKLNNPSNIELLVFGSSNGNQGLSNNIKTHFLGQFQDNVSLKLLYNAADIFVSPSMQENLSCVIIESLACGTPVVAFDIGGNGDIIKHNKNGYLAKPFNSDDLGKGINQILDHLNNYSTAGINKDIEYRFGESQVADVYEKVYKNILNNKGYN